MIRAAVLAAVVVALVAPRCGAEEAGVDLNGRCRELAAADDPLAVAICRDALDREPNNNDLEETLAGVEHRHGDVERALVLWRSLLADQGWSRERARGEAMALWRLGRSAEAEAALRELARRDPSPVATEDLIRFLGAFDRCAEAAREAESAAARFPDRCELQELWGAALSTCGDPSGAASHFAAAVERGCPRYRWTGLGSVPQNIDDPAFLALLRPAELVADLPGLDDRELLLRFELLRHVMVPAVAPQVVDQILSRNSPEVRLSGLGLLATAGSEAMASWSRLLAADDLMLRKNALRRIGELGDPAFVPLLEARLAVEPLPGNRNLAALVLGGLLIDGIDPARGRALLAAIPAADASFPAARLALADLAEQDGRYSDAVGLIDEARAAEPGLWVDPEREMRLRRRAGVAPSPSIPAPAATPAPAPGVE